MAEQAGLFVRRVVIATLLLVATAAPSLSETSQEPRSRELDAAEVRAMLAADRAALERLWSEHLVVSSPDSVVRSKVQVCQAIGGGSIRHSPFECSVEHVVIDGDIAISMGSEVVIPVGDRPDAGRRLARRDSHVWRRAGERWPLIARHANLPPTTPP